MALHIVIYSGGMDSFTLLHRVYRSQISRGKDPCRTMRAISFDYGQRHYKELNFAQQECDRLGLDHELIDLSALAIHLAGSSLTSRDIRVPEGHYSDVTMKATVVPGRNTVFLSMAMAYAEGLVMRGAAADAHVYYGAHSGDHAIYPDCRPEFVDAMARVYHQATEGRVSLQAPFLRMTKGDILVQGSLAELGAADYARTWTCYQGGLHPCGKCGACVEREEAFQSIGWKDPTAV